MSGTVVIIAGLSGVGKTTVSELLCERDNRFRMSRSHTSRAPRGDGRDAEYIYVSEDEFNSLLEKGELVEHTSYGGTSYGTSRGELYGIIADGLIPLLVLDCNGVRSLKSSGLFDCVCAIYLYADIDTVNSRLYGRMLEEKTAAEKKKTYETRIKVNISDCLDMPNRVESIDAFVKNEDLDTCVSEVIEWIARVKDGNPQPYDTRMKIAEALKLEAILWNKA